jgi:hypothetical protein
VRLPPTSIKPSVVASRGWDLPCMDFEAGNAPPSEDLSLSEKKTLRRGPARGAEDEIPACAGPSLKGAVRKKLNAFAHER